MLTEPILKIMTKNGIVLNFYYEEKTTEVYNKVLSATNDVYYAGSITQIFEKNKIAKSKEVLKKLRELAFIDASRSVLSIITGQNGEKYYIKVYDTPELVISKYEQAKGRRFNETEKQAVLKCFENLLENVLINAQLNQNAKKVRR